MNRSSEMEFEKEIFISYKRGGESEDFVNRLDETLQEKGIKILRDIRDIKYRESIQDFMERIGRGKCVITVISEGYLKSRYCMFELMQIANNEDFHDRIFPIVLDDANIYEPIEILQYIKYWENKIKELDEGMKGVGAANLQGIRENIDLYTDIRHTIAKLTDILRNMNALTPEIHQKSEFDELIKAIEKRLNQDIISLDKKSKSSTTQQTNTIQQIKIESLKKDKEKLLKDYQGVDEKKRMTSNPQEINTLQLQLDSIAKKIEEIEQKIENIENEAENKKIQELQKILSKFTEDEEKILIKKAFYTCFGEVWVNLANNDTPEEMLKKLDGMPKVEPNYTRVEEFVAYLCVELIKNSLSNPELKKWGENNIKKFNKLYELKMQEIVEKDKNKNSYLLIVIEKSNQDSASNNSDCYRIQASYISDIKDYKYNHENHICDGCESLNLSEYENQTFTIDKIGNVLNDILNKNIEYNFDCYGNLTIEIFLPGHHISLLWENPYRLPPEASKPRTQIRSI